jgi:long-chain acyl-CoA synthetase
MTMVGQRSDALPMLSQRIGNTLRDGGQRDALQYHGVWHNWADLAGFADNLITTLDAWRPGIRRVGLVAKNGPVVLASILGLVASGRSIVMLNGAQSPERLATEIASLNLAAVVAGHSYWTQEVREAAREAGSLQIILPECLDQPVEHWESEIRPVAPESEGDADIALELLSSGTTGHPKRVPILWRTLEAALLHAHGTSLFGADGTGLAGETLPPVISGLSLGNIGGIYIMLPSALIGQRIVLLDKFAVEPWARAVSLYRPEILSVQPVGLRMILDADVPPEQLASLKCIVSGASHLDPDLQDKFEQRYDVRVFGAYGATEFCGSIVLWTDELYDTNRYLKRGSVGRPDKGAEIRIIDAETSTVLDRNDIGLIEAKVDRVGPRWIRTTDLGRVDEDGFVFIVGRADNAINRGGFKIVPEEVVDALRRHPAVLDAAVIAMPDARLGEVPFAGVEIKPGQPEPDEQDLRDFLRAHLLAYQIPARIFCVPALPRNASLKVMAVSLREMFEQAMANDSKPN